MQEILQGSQPVNEVYNNQLRQTSLNAAESLPIRPIHLLTEIPRELHPYLSSYLLIRPPINKLFRVFANGAKSELLLNAERFQLLLNEGIPNNDVNINQTLPERLIQFQQLINDSQNEYVPYIQSIYSVWVTFTLLRDIWRWAKVLKPSHTIRQIGQYAIVPVGDYLSQWLGQPIYGVIARYTVDGVAVLSDPIGWGVSCLYDTAFKRIGALTADKIIMLSNIEDPYIKAEITSLMAAIARESAICAATATKETEKVKAFSESVNGFKWSLYEALKKNSTIVNELDSGLKQGSDLLDNLIDNCIAAVGLDPKIPLTLTQQEINSENELIELQNSIQSKTDEMSMLIEEKTVAENALTHLHASLKQKEHELNLHNLINNFNNDPMKNAKKLNLEMEIRNLNITMRLKEQEINNIKV